MESFSVLMSVYYRETPSNLREALSSVFNQTVSCSEVILIKDGPLSLELDSVIQTFSSSFSSLKVFALPNNVGLGNALNYGLSKCSNSLVARMDSDDISKVDRFEKQLDIFTRYPDISIVGSWIDEFNESPRNILAQRRLPEFNNEIILLSKKRCPLNHPTIMFRKEHILSVGGYMHCPYFEDYYLWARMISHKYKIYNIQDSLLYFRSNPAMIARRGGFNYAILEVKFIYLLYKMNFLSSFELTRNICIRTPVRLLPNRLRFLFYKYLLR